MLPLRCAIEAPAVITKNNPSLNVLVLNAGSSSIKVALIDAISGDRRLEMQAERLLDEPVIRFSDGEEIQLSKMGYEHALSTGLTALQAKITDWPLAGVGHRVVHGGEAFDAPTRIKARRLDSVPRLNPQDRLAIR